MAVLLLLPERVTSRISWFLEALYLSIAQVLIETIFSYRLLAHFLPHTVTQTIPLYPIFNTNK